MDWIPWLGVGFMVMAGVAVIWMSYGRREATKATLARGVPATATAVLPPDC